MKYEVKTISAPKELIKIVDDSAKKIHTSRSSVVDAICEIYMEKMQNWVVSQTETYRNRIISINFDTEVLNKINMIMKKGIFSSFSSCIRNAIENYSLHCVDYEEKIIEIIGKKKKKIQKEVLERVKNLTEENKMGKKVKKKRIPLGNIYWDN